MPGWFDEVAVPRTNMPVGQPVPFNGAGGMQPSAGVATPAPGSGPQGGESWDDFMARISAGGSHLVNSQPRPSEGGGVAGPTGGDPQQQIQAILKKYPPGSAGLQQAMPEIQAAFPGTRFDTSGGPVDEIVIPGYGLVDVLANAETGGNKSWTWQTGAGGGGAQQPWNFQGPGFPAGTIGAGAGLAGGAMGGTDYAARLPALEKTPGYQFRMDQGVKALDGSAASKGTLLTGGHAKDLTEFGQGLASTEFDNEYRRLFGMAGLGQSAAGAIGNFGSSYADNATGLITGAGNAQAAGTIGSGNAWNGALGGIGQNVMDTWMYNQYMKPRNSLGVSGDYRVGNLPG